MQTSDYLLKEQLLQDFIAAHDQILVLTAEHGVLLPTYDEKVAIAQRDHDRAIADFKKVLEQL